MLAPAAVAVPSGWAEDEIKAVAAPKPGARLTAGEVHAHRHFGLSAVSIVEGVNGLTPERRAAPVAD